MRTLLLVLLAGCNAQYSAPPMQDADNGRQVRLTEETVLMDNLVEGTVDVSEGELSVIAENLPVQVGDVLIGAKGGGYLRRVLSIENTDGNYRIQTTRADLKDVVASGELHGDVDLSDRDTYTYTLDSKVLVDESLNFGDLNSSARLEMTGGELTISPTIAFDADFGFNTTAQLDVNVDVDSNIGFTGNIEGDWTGGEELVILEKEVPFYFEAGPVPVVGTVNVKVYAGVEGTSAGDASFDANGGFDLDLTASAGYDDGWWSDGNVVTNPSFNLEHQATIDGRFHVYLRAEVGAVLYETLAADIAAQANLELGFCTTGASLSASADANLTAGIEWFDRTLTSHTFELYEDQWDLWQTGECI